MEEDWKKYRVIDFIDINPKVPLKKGNEYSFVEMKDLNANSKYVLPSVIKALKGGARFRNQDTLFARITPCLQNGKICQVKNLENNLGFGSTEFLVFRGKQDVSDSDFIYYLSRDPFFRKFSESKMIGTSGRQRVAKDAFNNLELEFPPLPEQRAIASILSALDDKIELNLQMNKTLEDMAMALYKHWIVDFGPFQNGKFVDSELGKIPEGWEVKRLDEIIDFSNGYAFKSKELLKVEEEDCFHIFKMGHILKGGGLKANGTKSWIKKSKCEKLEKYILKVGDILMSMTDMKDNMTILGHTALMNEDQKFIVNQRVGLLRVNNKIGIGYPFVFLLTNSTDFIERLRSQANSGVQVNLSTGAIKSATLVAPTKSINKEFHEMVKPFYERINQNAIENQTLTKTRDTLLPKLISGEVRVKDIEKIIAPMI